MEAIRQAIAHLCEGDSIDEKLIGRVAAEILSGEATAAQIGAFLVGLRIRGEQPEHLRGFVEVMRRFAAPLPPGDRPDLRDHLVDTCGTGGDATGTFNISTAAAIVAAGAGARIAKHGNRAVTSAAGSGSADVLAALGVNVECSPETSLRCLEQCGLAFFFAPAYHGAMRHAGPARREIGVRTILNLLGPLANPAGTRRQLIGVGSAELTEVFARVLTDVGSEHVMVVHGSDGMDEITLTGPTRVTEARHGDIRTYTLQPLDHGLELCRIEDLRVDGEDQAAARAAVINDILAGRPGPKRRITEINAAAALMVGAVAGDWADALIKSSEAIDSGASRRVLDQLISISNEQFEPAEPKP